MSAWTSRLAWLAVVLAPPTVATVAGRDAVARHPVLAMLLVLGYWSVVAALKFVGAIAKELGGRWRGIIVERVDRATRRRLSRFSTRYRRHLLRSLQFVDLKGLATIGPNNPELDEVYVDVSLAPRAPHQVPSHLLADIPTTVAERHDIWNLLDQPAPAVLAVVGAPGSGKTTLLRHTALRMCRRSRGRRRRTPVLLFLRDHVAAITADPAVGLPELVVGTLGWLRSKVPPDWFESRLRAGDCLILLDGLDEVASDEDRRAISRWAFEQTRQWPGNDYVITSRPQGYRAAPVEGATVMQVRPFTAEQVDRFVHGWYLAIERHTTQADDEDVHCRAREQADDLLERLRNATALGDLTANPLLLTMIATVHRYRGALPGSRADLYREICEVMLWRRQHAKRLETVLGGDKKEKVLRQLAHAMMAARVRDLPRDKILIELRSALRRVSKSVTAEEFLADVGSNGLLLERESGVYTFAHLTFQEYLAAAQLRDCGLRDVVRLVDDGWWRETLLLYAATANADPIVEACLRRNTPMALALAFDCEDQGSDIAPELRAQLEQLMFSGDREHRRLLVGVMAVRYLRQAVPVPGGGRVCVGPVPADLFRVYLQEEGLPDEVDLVHAGHAARFPQWLNEFSGHVLGGRLPTNAELDAPALRNVLRSSTPARRVVWVAGQRYRWPVLSSGWPSAASPLAIDYTELAERVAQDLSLMRNTVAQLVLRSAKTAAPGEELLRSATPLYGGRQQVLTDREPRASAAVTDLLVQLTGSEVLAGDNRIEWLFQLMDGRLDKLDHLLGLDLDRQLSRPLWNRVVRAMMSRRASGQGAQGFLAAFARTLADTRSQPNAEVPFESLGSMLSAATADMMRCQEQWISVSASRFAAYARPYASFQRVVTPESARLVRLAAMVLAAQAEAYRYWRASVNYRTVAAGVTILEDRESGVRADREMLVLAVS